MAKRRRPPRMIELARRADPSLGRFPGVQARLDKAMGVLGPGPAPAMCPHGPGPALWLCCQHPETGLFCFECMARHVAGHGVEEYRCDSCDEIPPGRILKPLAWPVEMDFYAVEGGPARRSTVIVQGIGICRRCRGTAVA